MTRKTLLTGAVSLAVLTSFWISGAVAQLSGTERDEFIKASIKACIDTAHARNANTPMSNLTTFCTCMAGGEADMTTAADAAYMAQHNEPTEDYRTRLRALAPNCNSKAGLH